MGVVDASIDNAHNIFDRTFAGIPGLISFDSRAIAVQTPKTAQARIIGDVLNRDLLVDLGIDDVRLFAVIANNRFCAGCRWDLQYIYWSLTVRLHGLGEDCFDQLAAKCLANFDLASPCGSGGPLNQDLIRTAPSQGWVKVVKEAGQRSALLAFWGWNGHGAGALGGQVRGFRAVIPCFAMKPE